METMIPILYRIIINLNEDLFVSISFSNYYINILLIFYYYQVKTT